MGDPKHATPAQPARQAPATPHDLRQPSFAELLRRHRTAAGLTQEELAERATLSARAISDLERGLKTRPQRETVRLLAAALGLAEPDRDRLAAAARAPLVAVPSPHALTQPSSNLPAPPTPLIGRETAVAAAVARLRQPGVRLLTVTGPGGVGKSRLALAVAELLRADYPEGTFFVPLAALDDPALVAAAIARLLGVADRGDQPLPAALPAAIGERRLLLVLDNFEHLLSATPFIEGLLATCPHVTLLLTSRATLRSPWEHEYPLPPLALPALGTDDPTALARIPAVALFLQRAAAVRPDFGLTGANAPAVAAICRRLAGLPLALELAAARLRLLTPTALLDRLDAPLRLLSGEAPGLPARQRTMRATIAWSHDLLPPEQAAVFRRLAVFAGGCTLAAAEAVCSGDGIALDAVLDAVGALADHSLLHPEIAPTDEQGTAAQDDEAETRLGMLEMVREFGLEQLRERGEEQATRQHHAAFFLALAREAEPALTAPGPVRWLEQLEREHDNVRAALGWAIESGDANTALGLAGSLTRFWRLHGHFREGRSWLERALAADDAPTAARAKALLGAGVLAWRHDDIPAAAAHLAASLALFRTLGDVPGVAGALNSLGIVTAHGGNLAGAQALNEESLALRRTLGDRLGIAVTLNSLGEIARRRDNQDRAQALYTESLALYRAAGDNFGSGVLLHNLGEVALQQGDHPRAASYFRESLLLHQALGNTFSIAYQIVGLAGVAALAGSPAAAVRAARLFGAAEALFTAIGARIDPTDRPNHERNVAAARAHLDAATFDAAHAAGLTLTLAEAIAEALTPYLTADKAEAEATQVQ